MRGGARHIASHGQRHAQQVLGTVIVLAFLQRRRQQGDGPIHGTRVNRERGGVHLFLGRPRCRVWRPHLALADAQIEQRALVQFLFLRIGADHLLQDFGGIAVLLGLQRLHRPLVSGHRFGVRAAPGRGGWRDVFDGSRGPRGSRLGFLDQLTRLFQGTNGLADHGFRVAGRAGSLLLRDGWPAGCAPRLRHGTCSLQPVS